MSYGYLHKARGVRDWLFGSSVKWPVLQEDGQWTKWLVEKELQNKGVETQACVSYHELNVVEMLIFKMTGKEKNYSDRFTAKMSGTTKQGNYFFNVANSIKNDGLVGELLWPYVNGWDNYYKEIPAIVEKQAENFKEKYLVNYRWVDENPKAMMAALKESPLAISARYAQGRDGEILSPVGQQNHAMTCYGFVEGEYWLIMDSYEYGGHLKKYAWDYKFGCAMQFKVTIKEDTMTNPIKILKLKDKNDVGFWIPATSEAAFTSLGYSFSKYIQKKDGKVDWDASIEGEFTLKE